MDAVGNVIGRLEPAGAAAGAAAVGMGSHLDTVPCGGAFDGALGVVAALAVLQTLAEQGRALPLRRPIEIMAFADEEGRFGGMLGSQAVTGTVDAEWFARARNDDGELLTEAMVAAGLDPQQYLQARREPGALSAWLELHIEQGPVLEHAGQTVGVVTSIAGTVNWDITLTGEANHSGTTPMELRRDAFLGAAVFGSRIPAILERRGDPSSRITVGALKLSPGFAHTVPGRAELALNVRAADDATMLALADECRAELKAAADAHHLQLSIDEKSWLKSAACHPDIIALTQRTAAALGESDVRIMSSGAGHDTQNMGAITADGRVGMIFVPSRKGISHSPAEHTDWADVERGANVMLHTILELACEP